MQGCSKLWVVSREANIYMSLGADGCTAQPIGNQKTKSPALEDSVRRGPMWEAALLKRQSRRCLVYRKLAKVTGANGKAKRARSGRIFRRPGGRWQPSSE
jgi:hypothetical protein